MQIARLIELKKIGVIFLLSTSSPAFAQIVPDATLPNNSNITVEGDTNTINGGTQAGSNLFHSFEQFSVPTGETAHFNNASDIQNIFSRVTGTSVSDINGLIRANGSADLFLLNPNGIVFGSNARLDIGGSFLGSTASSIKFADGIQFTTITPQVTPLLTVTVPVGLGFGNSPKAIDVKSTGHTLRGIGASPVTRRNPSIGLQVQPGKTLALVGGAINLEGGILTAEGGRVELGSVGNGTVKLNSTGYGWNLEYLNVPSFENIQLSEHSLVDVSGIGIGSIQVQGKRVTLSDGSVILKQNQGLQSSGNINVNAVESLEVSGTDPLAEILGGLWNETLGFGDGGEIVVSSPKLALRSGGTITTRTYGNAKAGDIILNAPESLQVLGGSPITPRAVSNITSFTFGSGLSGNIKASTGMLTVAGGGNLSSSTALSGKGGDVVVNATDSVELYGVKPGILLPSAISASTLGSTLR